MRMRTVILGVSLVFGVGLMCEASAQAVAQNANKPAAARKAKPAAKSPEAKPAAAPAPQATAEKPMAKPKPKRKASQSMSGVPKGVPACIKHLAKMAEKDPLINYEGHPSDIVNNGLLWNDPKSHCSVASDDAMKKKVVELAAAWRAKDSAKVRSLLGELESAAGSK